MSTLMPWARGAFELLRHAEGHLNLGTDFDKRMALVSFDNAIEVSISTFLQLHPTQRNNKTYDKVKVAEWQANYYSKLEFLYGCYLPDHGIDYQVTREEIIWYHNLRNQLYHSGNGMVPEESSLAGVRKAAVWTFSLLYDVDADALLKTNVPSPKPVAQATGRLASPELIFLAAYIDLEYVIFRALDLLRGKADLRHVNRSIRRMWPLFQSEYHISKVYDAVIVRATQVRNELVHGRPVRLGYEELTKLAAQVETLTEVIKPLIPEHGVVKRVDASDAQV